MTELDKAIKGFPSRLCSALDDAGFSDPIKAARAMIRVGAKISPAGIRKHRYGQEFPNGRNTACYAMITKQSIDWLYFGRLPEHPGLAQFEEMLAGAKSVSLSSVPDQDPDVSRILDIVLAMPSDSRKKAIEFLELTTMRPKR